MVEENNPLFSIIIITYNQEKFIEETLISAFNQTYKKYEIIISDDHSTDSTWSIINLCIERYNKDNIKVILNRNETNKGILLNYQTAFAFCSNDWIVSLAGDDVMYENRLELIKIYIDDNVLNNIFAIGTGYDIINENSKVILENIPCVSSNDYLPIYPGCSAVIKKQTFSEFPIIEKALQSEDIIYSLRALELGSIYLTDFPSLKHRVHSNNITSKGNKLKDYHGKILNHENAIFTLKYYKDNLLIKESLKSLVDNTIDYFYSNIDIYNNIISFLHLNLFSRIFNLFSTKILNIPFKAKFKIFIYQYKVLIYVYEQLFFLKNKLMRLSKKTNHYNEKIVRI